MNHNDIYEAYKNIMPIYEERTVIWFANGPHSIRVRLDSDEDYAFTYLTERNWKFETIDSFIDNMTKGGKSNA